MRGAALIVVAILSMPLCAAAQNLVPNGLFEEGDGAVPRGWQVHVGDWVKNGGRHGSPCLSVVTKSRELAWESETFGVEPSTDLRLEAWVRCRAGHAALELDLSGSETGDRRAQTISVEPAADWQYVALELDSETATTASIKFIVDGEAEIDDVSLAPSAVSTFANKGVEPDRRNRLGFFDDEQADILPGIERGGTRRFDSELRHEGQNSVVLEPASAEHWFGIGSVNYPLQRWTSRLRASAWVRCASPVRAMLAVCWTDDDREIVGIDVSPEVQSDDWQRLEWLPPGAPANATMVRLVAVARGGPVWFDEFELEALRPEAPIVKVFVNQVGYDAQGPKSAVAATNFLPAGKAALDWELRGEGGATASGTAGCSGRIHSGTSNDWGWYFWRVDFSNVEAAGDYRLTVTATAPRREETAVANEVVRAESPRVAIEPQALLRRTASAGVDFFFVQRCGYGVPGWHAACHLDDARLPDGTHIDVTGGWHSAGDYNKPMWQFGDSAAVYALAAVFDEHRSALSAVDRDADGTPDALDEAWWGAKFLAKMQNPADGSLRGDVNQGPGRDWMRWTAPEEHTDNQVGTADDPVIAQPVGNTPLAIAGWARLAQLLNDRNIDNDYLDRAERLWEFSTAQSAAVSNPLLLLGAIELDSATSEERYRQFADTAVETLLDAQRPDGSYPGDSGDHGDWAAAALASYALRYPVSPHRDRLRKSLERYLEFCLSRADNPFGLSRQGSGTAEDPVYFHPSVGLGVNFWLLGRAWAALLIHRLTDDRRALVYAVDQIDWVFGKNPLSLCMFEGQGQLNPPRYHHRYNMLPGKERGAVPGAIPNGFIVEMGIADRPGFDLSRSGGRSPSFRTSEPWLVHNVMHLLAVGALPESD